MRYWLHNGMLTMAGEKMSKSVGNIVTIRELLARHDGETLRYALLSGHYRQSLTWSDALIAQAKASLGTLYGALRDAGDGRRRDRDDHLGPAAPRYPGNSPPKRCGTTSIRRGRWRRCMALAAEMRRTDRRRRRSANCAPNCLRAARCWASSARRRAHSSVATTRTQTPSTP